MSDKPSNPLNRYKPLIVITTAIVTAIFSHAGHYIGIENTGVTWWGYAIQAVGIYLFIVFHSTVSLHGTFSKLHGQDSIYSRSSKISITLVGLLIIATTSHFLGLKFSASGLAYVGSLFAVFVFLYLIAVLAAGIGQVSAEDEFKRMDGK